VPTPHTEGSFAPASLRLLFSDVPEDEVRTMTSTAAAEVYGCDLDKLQAVADEIGPTVEEVATPVTPDELPSESMSASIMPALAAAHVTGRRSRPLPDATELAPSVAQVLARPLGSRPACRPAGARPAGTLTIVGSGYHDAQKRIG
jgi:hypothetical protein